MGTFLDNNKEIIYNNENNMILDFLLSLAYKKDKCKHLIIIECLI